MDVSLSSNFLTTISKLETSKLVGISANVNFIFTFSQTLGVVPNNPDANSKIDAEEDPALYQQSATTRGKLHFFKLAYAKALNVCLNLSKNSKIVANHEENALTSLNLEIFHFSS